MNIQLCSIVLLVAALNLSEAIKGPVKLYEDEAGAKITADFLEDKNIPYKTRPGPKGVFVAVDTTKTKAQIMADKNKWDSERQTRSLIDPSDLTKIHKFLNKNGIDAKIWERGTQKLLVFPTVQAMKNFTPANLGENVDYFVKSIKQKYPDMKYLQVGSTLYLLNADDMKKVQAFG